MLSALSVAKIFRNVKFKKGFTALYCILATALACISLVCSLLDFGLDCPNSDHLMGCTSVKHWMVPRNYCAAQLAECNVLEDQKNDMQMCVRMGRAPLVNGAFSTWLIRTVMLDVIRVMLLVVVVALAYASDATPSGQAQTDAVASHPVRTGSNRPAPGQHASSRATRCCCLKCPTTGSSAKPPRAQADKRAQLLSTSGWLATGWLGDRLHIGGKSRHAVQRPPLVNGPVHVVHAKGLGRVARHHPFAAAPAAKCAPAPLVRPR